jgi:tetratricopeptide (TPR) repeat protein
MAVAEVEACLKKLQELQAQGVELHADVYYYKALCQKRLGRRDAAMASILRALRAAPAEPDYLLEYGLLLIDDGRTQEGLDKLRQAVHESDHAPQFRHELYLQNALALQTEGFVDAALLSFQKALKFGRRAETYRLIGQMLIEAGRNQQALEILREGVTEFADDAPLHYLIGRALLEDGHPHDAIAPLVRACELDRNDASALYVLGTLFERIKETARAVQAYERCLTIPLAPSLHKDIERRLGRLRSAVPPVTPA